MTVSHSRRVKTSSVLVVAWARYAAVSVVVAVAITLGGCGGDPVGSASDSKTLEATPAGVRVTVATAEARNIPRQIAVVGTMLAYEQTKLGNKVEGRVVELAADVGDRLPPGRVVVTIDPTDYQWAERQARQGLLETLAVLGLLAPTSIDLDSPPEVPEGLDVGKLAAVRRAVALSDQARADLAEVGQAIEASRARIAVAEAEATNAEDKLARNTRLRQTQVITQQEWQDAQTRADSARATLRATRADLAAVEARTATAQAAVAAAEAQVAVVAAEMLAKVSTARRMQAGLQLARQKLADTAVTVPALPADGGPEVRGWVVSERLASPGQFAKVGDPLIRLVITDVLRLRVQVPERYANRVAIGQAVTVTTEATGQAPLTGQVSRIHPVVDATNRNFQVEVRLVNTDGQLKPGVFAQALITLGVDTDVVFVPASAVVRTVGVAKVFVIDGGPTAGSTPAGSTRVIERPVTVGGQLDDLVEIVAGLSAGQTVVTSGQRLLVHGSPVRVVSSPEAP